MSWLVLHKNHSLYYTKIILCTTKKSVRMQYFCTAKLLWAAQIKMKKKTRTTMIVGIYELEIYVQEGLAVQYYVFAHKSEGCKLLITTKDRKIALFNWHVAIYQNW